MVCYQKGWSHLRLRLDNDIFTQNSLLLPVPQHAHCPPPTPSPVPSPALFRLTFTGVSYKFRHPPIPTPSSLHSRTSSTPGISSSDFIPCSLFGTLPPTPSTSDDEFVLASLWFNVQCPSSCQQLLNRLSLPSTMVRRRRPVERRRASHSTSLF